MTGETAAVALREYSQKITNIALRNACNVVLSHPYFVKSFGSAKEHHCYYGGLAVHTYEVTSYAHQMGEMFFDADDDVILTAAIFHDFMKVREYDILETTPGCVEHEPFAVKTPYRNLVRHVAGSHAEFLKAIDFQEDRNGETVPADVIMKIEHTILAHHGRFEWGSPIEPQLVEAHILHFADQFSVHYGPGKERPS